MICLSSRSRLRRMLDAAVILFLSALFVGCPSEVWIPMGAQRAAVARGKRGLSGLVAYTTS
jgi:hypothetical protein